MTYPTVLPMSARVLEEVSRERQAQQVKWGEQNHPDGTGLHMSRDSADYARYRCQQAARDGVVTWEHIMTEEHYEALAETNPARLREELIQVAAVAVAWVEAIDRRREP